MEKTDSTQKKVMRKDFFKGKNIVAYAVVAILAVVFLFLVFGKTSDDANSGGDAVMEYVENLEKRLSENLSKVSGAGKVSVVVSVEAGMETVLAMTSTTNTNDNGTTVVEEPVIVNGKTIVLKEMYPKITGVLIVAEGADNITVRRKLEQATISLLNIGVNNIEILSMS